MVDLPQPCLTPLAHLASAGDGEFYTLTQWILAFLVVMVLWAPIKWLDFLKQKKLDEETTDLLRCLGLIVWFEILFIINAAYIHVVPMEPRPFFGALAGALAAGGFGLALFDLRDSYKRYRRERGRKNEERDKESVDCEVAN